MRASLRFALSLIWKKPRGDKTFDTNVKGYFLFAQAVGRQMIDQGQGGKIVNITSVSVHESGEHKVHYCASKAAVGSLTKGLALEFARFGIRVNAVEPGSVDTLIVKDDYLAGTLATLQTNPGLPINRIAKGSDMVGAVLFLCSEAAAYMTGASILVDGGGYAGSQLPDDCAARVRERQAVIEARPVFFATEAQRAQRRAIAEPARCRLSASRRRGDFYSANEVRQSRFAGHVDLEYSHSVLRRVKQQHRDFREKRTHHGQCQLYWKHKQHIVIV